MVTGSRAVTSVADDQHARIPAGYRPRRSPVAGLPRLAEADRLDPAELARLRKRLRPRFVLIVRG